MHLHFAKLENCQHTNVTASGGKLFVGDVVWKPWCRFPTIEEDLLLYLAVLGGNTYSGYYDLDSDTTYSTLDIFSMHLRGQGSPTGENTNAANNNYKIYENMVGHMIFCASRRHGVRGIPFKDFFPLLLREFQSEITSEPMMIDGTEKTISDLLEGYDDLAQLPGTTIPFLAQPNAQWPQCILEARDDGCNFGRLDRPENKDRCDICVYEYLSDVPVFLCECKYWGKNVGMDTMKRIIGGLESVWKEKWKIVFVFCGELEKVRTDWEHQDIGCVKIDCRSCRGKWVFQPAEGARKKLIVAMETGSLDIVTYMSFRENAA